MGNLYKRIVTIGMISFTAILAFLYCILVYRTEAIYVVAASLVVIGSIYAFLLALVDLRIKKEEETKQFAEEKLKEFAAAQNKSDELVTIERLLKASYVQQRKTNTRLAELTEESKRIAQESQDNDQAIIEELQRQMVEAINKAMKIMVKYSQKDNENLLSITREISAYITTMSADLDKLAKGLDNVTAEIKSIEFSPVINVEGVVSAPTTESTTTSISASANASLKETATTVSELSEVVDDTDDVEGFDAEAFLSSFESSNYTDNEKVNNIVSDETVEETIEETIKETVEETAVETTENAPANEDPNQLLSQDAIAALFAASNTDSKEEEVKETVEEDPNRQLSPEEIAAMFEASKEERRAKSDDDFKVFEHPEAMDQSLIDALLGNISEDEESIEVHDVEKETVEDLTADENLADVIPFPTRETAEETKEEPVAEEPVAVTPVDDNPNRQLSPDEIAALFASASGDTKTEPITEEPVEEIKEEPVAVTPVDDNPNRQLSPDEIAALFASASGDTKTEPITEEPVEEIKEEPVAEEPVTVTPVDDNPNRQLSPEEIAALFASASGDTKTEPITEEPIEEIKEEPVAITPVDDNPNRQLSPEEIAALFASVQ